VAKHKVAIRMDLVKKIPRSRMSRTHVRAPLGRLSVIVDCEHECEKRVTILIVP
jgi:hypothetical protein